jgi:hypothetical protein
MTDNTRTGQPGPNGEPPPGAAAHETHKARHQPPSAPTVIFHEKHNGRRPIPDLFEGARSPHGLGSAEGIVSRVSVSTGVID